MTESANSLLELLKKANISSLKSMEDKFSILSFEDRIASIREEKGALKVSFYSDNLTLKDKIQIENFLKSFLTDKIDIELSILFIRKEKTQKNDSPKETKGNPKERNQGSSSLKSIPGVKHIVAVASGKGGVGKSTVSVNLAVSLKNKGYKIGLLDADIYGPSLPMMLGLRTEPKVDEHSKMLPPEAHGIKMMSFGFFAPDDTAVIWRGPMVMKALQQFFWNVTWGDLDYLIIDLPPGTGDVQLTLVQSLPLFGAIVVTTPQNVALLDAAKAINMFDKTNVPILGVVENMSAFVCPSCSYEAHIFGKGGASKINANFSVPILGQIPIHLALRASGDNGRPLPSYDNDNPISKNFSEVAENLIKKTIEVQEKKQA